MPAEKPQLSRYRDRMDKAVSALKEEFASLRTGRASANLLDQIMVEAYGATTPLNQVAAVTVPEPRSISVSVWDRGVVVSVEKAIRSSDLGLNPVVEGQTLRIPIPPLLDGRAFARDYPQVPHTGLAAGIRDTIARFRKLYAQGGLDVRDLPAK